MILKLLPAGVAAAVWAALSAKLVGIQMNVLQWAGTANAGPSPQLAEAAFRVTTTAMLVLFAEGFVRGMTPAIVGLANYHRSRRQVTDDEQLRLSRLLRENRRSQSRPPAAPNVVEPDGNT